MFDMLNSKNIEVVINKIIAAMLTIAANGKDETEIWDIYNTFLNKMELNMITKEDYNKIIAALKKNGY